MTRRVWKYTLEFHTPSVFDMPEDAEIVHVNEQNGFPTMWVLVDDCAPTMERIFFICGTGDAIRRDAKYVGSVHDGEYVWHIFEIPEPETMEQKIRREFAPLSQKDLNTRMTM